MEEFDKIKSLLAEHKIDEACNALKKYAISERTLNEIFLQKSRYYKINMDTVNGVVSEDYVSKEMSKVVHSILQIVDKVKKEAPVIIEKKKQNEETVVVDLNNKSDLKEVRKNSLYEEGDEYYNAALRSVGHNKRNVHINCTNAIIIYKILISEYPNDAWGFLCLAQSLKTMYLVNYNKDKNEEKLNEIVSCVEHGKGVDSKKLYHDRFNLVLLDIKEHTKKRKMQIAAYVSSVTILSLTAIDDKFFKYFSCKDESIGMVLEGVFFLVFMYAFTLDNKIENHIKGS